MEHELTARAEARGIDPIETAPPSAPLEMPKQQLERHRAVARPGLLMRLFGRHA